jgi:hypothetical protein
MDPLDSDSPDGLRIGLFFASDHCNALVDQSPKHVPNAMTGTAFGLNTASEITEHLSGREAEPGDLDNGIRNGRQTTDAAAPLGKYSLSRRCGQPE